MADVYTTCTHVHVSDKNIHFEMISDVGIGKKIDVGMYNNRFPNVSVGI